MKLDKAWPTFGEALTKSSQVKTIDFDKLVDVTKSSDKLLKASTDSIKGTKVWPKQLVESTVQKSLSELLKESFSENKFEFSEDAEDAIDSAQKAEKPRRKSKRDDIFKREETPKSFEQTKHFKREDLEELQQNRYSKDSRGLIDSETQLKYIWICLAIFCLLSFFTLNSILCKLKILESLISRQS